MRRFLFRDASIFVALTLVFATSGLLPMMMLATGSKPLDVFAIKDFISFFVFLGAAIVDGYMHFAVDPARGLPSRVRLVLVTACQACVQIPHMLMRPAARHAACGVDAAAANNTDAAQLDDSQQYCVDAVDFWPLLLCVTFTLVWRMYPAAAVPMAFVGAAMYLVGIAVRDLAVFPDAPHTRHGATVAALALVYLIGAAISSLLCVRLHAVDRLRFLAAAGAEGARRLALNEQRETDLLLHRALPGAVLERVTSGCDVVDESEDVTVLMADVDVPGLHALGDDFSTQTVANLHAIVAAFDAQLESGAAHGVTKVKTVGDMYWAVAGLPSAVQCHASGACRFAAGLQRVGESAIDRDTAAGLKVRAGLHTGPATAAILGTQRLSYEPFGPACDGARAALRAARPTAGAVCVSDAVKRRLAAEATLYAGTVDSEALFATPADVDAALELSEAPTSGIVLYDLPPSNVPDASAVSEAVLRRLVAADRDDTSVRSHTLDRGALLAIAGTSAADPDWVANALAEQQQRLQQRVEFLLRRAAEAERRGGSATQRKRRARYRNAATKVGRTVMFAPAKDSADTTSEPDAARYEIGADAAAQLAQLEDAENGPFSDATCCPLVYSFADAEEEAAYIDFARSVTHAARRDLRIGTAVLFWGCLAFIAGTGAPVMGVVLLAGAAGLCSVNAVLMAWERGAQADTVLAHLAIALFVAGLYASDGNVLGNDPFWAVMVYLLTVTFTTWTLSPLSRSALFLVVAVAGAAKSLVVTRAGPTTDTAGMTVACVVSVPLLLSLGERYLRRAFTERRLAEALVAQQRAAQHAQTAMLHSVVPAAVVRPLRAWLAGGSTPDAAVVAYYSQCAVAALRFAVGNTAVLPVPMSDGDASSTAASPGRSGTIARLMQAHRLLDSFLDALVVAEKVKTFGDTAFVWAPLAPNVNTAPLLGSFVAEMLFVARSLSNAGAPAHAAVHVGPIAGAVLGTERLSFDVVGPTVREAVRFLESAVSTGGHTSCPNTLSPTPSTASIADVDECPCFFVATKAVAQTLHMCPQGCVLGECACALGAQQTPFHMAVAAGPEPLGTGALGAVDSTPSALSLESRLRPAAPSTEIALPLLSQTVRVTSADEKYGSNPLFYVEVPKDC